MENYKITTIQREKVSNKGKAKFLGFSGQPLFVEQVALEDYEKRGYVGLWSANEFWWAIMTLLFWDVIYAPVKGAVSFAINGSDQRIEPNPDELSFNKSFLPMIHINGMPADFYTPNFYKNRKSLFERKIHELNKSIIPSVLEKSHKIHYGLNCRPIEKWDRFTLEQLQFGINSFSKEQLIKLMQYLMEDFTYRRKGLPDLFLHNEEGPLFVEVKAKDKLSIEQESWLRYIKDELGIQTEVCVVNETTRTGLTNKEEDLGDDRFIEYLNEVEGLIKDKKLDEALNRSNEYLNALHEQNDDSWYMMYYQIAVIHAKEKRWEDALLNMGFVIYYLGRSGGVGHEQFARRLLKKLNKEDQYQKYVKIAQSHKPEYFKKELIKLLNV